MLLRGKCPTHCRLCHCSSVRLYVRQAFIFELICQIYFHLSVQMSDMLSCVISDVIYTFIIYFHLSVQMSDILSSVRTSKRSNVRTFQCQTGFRLSVDHSQPYFHLSVRLSDIDHIVPFVRVPLLVKLKSATVSHISGLAMKLKY